VPFIATNRIVRNKSVAALIATVMFFSAAHSVEEKYLSVYSPVATYTLPVLERSGHEYVGLLELLEPLGRVSSESNGHLLKLSYNAIDAEFVAGKTRGRIHGRDFEFSSPFIIENSRGFVPVGSLSALLSRFVGAQVNFRESARRLFIGDIGIQPSFHLDAGDPPKLVISFSAPVNPTIATAPGELRMLFKRDPVVSPGSQSISFDDKIITRATYSENNGVAEFAIATSQPLMASFSGDRKTITLSATQQPTTSNGTPSGVSNGSPPPNPPAAAASVTAAAVPGNPVSAPRRPLAVVDPAHGGDERGAALSDSLAEKDVTLGFARLLRHELETRGFAVALTRDSDTGLTLDQRAAAANGDHAAIYISLHADSLGTGARVYTSLLPVEGGAKGEFRAWNSAQAPALEISRAVSAAIGGELQKNAFPVRTASASLRPLNNVFVPAVAVELAPGPGGVADLTSANYQQRAAAAIADGVVSVRDRLGVQP